MTNEIRWIDDKDSRFWTVERAASSILSPQFPERAQLVARRRRPVSTMFFNTRPRLAELQQATLSIDAESVSPVGDLHERPVSLPASSSVEQPVEPFTKPLQRRLPASPSAALLSRKFNFYYWSVSSEECYSIDCFLTENTIPIPLKTDHAINPIRGRAAIQVVRAAKKLIVVHSRKEISKIAITPETTDVVLAGLILDQEGFLKAPCVRVGSTVVIGYSASIFKSALFFGNTSPSLAKKQSRMKRLTRGASNSLIAPFKAIHKSMTQDQNNEEDHPENQMENHSKVAHTPKRQKVTSSVLTSPAAAWSVGIASPPLSPVSERRA